MIKRFSLLSLTTLVFLTMLLSVGFKVEVIAQSEQIAADVSSKKVTIPDDSVLHLIPQDTLGLIYCPSLSELNHKINMMVADLMPQAGATDLLAKILAGAFGAGFESLAELEDIGLDLNKDFAIFFSSLKPRQVSATVHLTDPEAIKQVIADEAEQSAPTEYKGVTYWSSAEGGGNFAILGNILIFSQQSEVCKKVIDTRNGTMPAITHNPDDGMFRTDILKGIDQLGVYLDFETTTAATFADALEEGLESFISNLTGENDTLPEEASLSLTNAFNSWSELIQQLQYVSVTLQVQGTDVQLKPFLKFKNDSEFMEEIKAVSDKLSNIEVLPNQSIVNAAFQGVPKLLVEISTFWFDIFPKDTPGQQKQLNPLFQEVQHFYESLADRWTFSVNFENSILPNYLFIYELKDEQSVRNFMDGKFIEKLHEYHDAYAGKSIIHNGVEIKSYVFPNFNQEAKSSEIIELIPEFSELIPSEWHWYYAFTDGQLFWSTGTSVESIKMALDRKAGMGDKFSDNPSFQKLVESLGTENNVFLAISPIIGIKNFFPLLGKLDPNNAASMQMASVMFANLPDNYSIGLSAKVQDNGIDSNILLAIGDFKTLIQMFGMMFGTEQMQ